MLAEMNLVFDPMSKLSQEKLRYLLSLLLNLLPGYLQSLLFLEGA